MAQPTTTKRPGARRRWGVFESAGAVLLTLVLVGVLATVNGYPARASAAMQPTIPQGSRLWLTGVTDVERGDVVVIAPDSRWSGVVADNPGAVTKLLRWVRLDRPPQNSTMLVRIVGLPGDEVRCCEGGNLLVNGRQVPIRGMDTTFRVVVPGERYFVGTDTPSVGSSHCYLASLGVEALVPRHRITDHVDRVGWPWRRTDISASGVPFQGIPGQAAPPAPIIEAGKDPSC
ncbi:S26 family signal peptidase [Propionibacteriaceae bacterium G57]|uniref:S26 family signal peptidase n=1 Tax=Aestuariimicrobium sp. G57 TaxID=3418485 RepID=UPI003DA79C02